MRLTLGEQVVWLFMLALPIAVVSWTVTHEEIFREPRDYCTRRSHEATALLSRKLYYALTCEYCFSHYVTLAFLVTTDYRLLLPDWRGLIIAFFGLVGIANAYMSFYSRVRVEIWSERAEGAEAEKVAEKLESEIAGSRTQDGGSSGRGLRDGS